MSQPPSPCYAPSSPRTKRAPVPDPAEDYKDTKPPTSPKPLPRSYYNIDTSVASETGQAGSKSKPPVTAPKPIPVKGDYFSPRPASPASNDCGIPRSNSYGHSPLSAALKQVMVASTLQRSSSMDENLNSALHHPLQKSSLASEYRCVQSSKTSSQVPSSPVPSSPVPSFPNPNVPAAGASGTEPLAQTEGEGDDSEQTPLSVFLKQRQQDLPLQIKVCNGYLGNMESDSMSSGEVFSLLFLKHTEVIEAEQFEQKYFIPLNSAVKARIPYQKCQNPYKLTVSDIMAFNEPPLVIKAVNCYQCSNDKCSVDEDEVFMVEGVKTVVMSRFLQVYSVTHQAKKKLKVDCNASFTTNATLYMPDIVQHLSAKFPLKVVLYFDQETSLSNLLSEREVTLLKHDTRSTVIASLLEGGKIDACSRISSLLEVSVDMDVTVLDLNLDKCDRKALIAQARGVLKKFDPTGISILSTNGRTVELVRKGHERSWYKLDVPPSLVASEASDSKQECHETADDEEEEEAGNYEDIDVLRPAPPQGKVDEKGTQYAAGNADLGSLAVQVNVMRRSVENMQAQTNLAESLSRGTKNQVASLKMETAMLKSRLDEMEKAMAALTERVESVLSAGVSHTNTRRVSGDDVVTRRDQQDTVLLESLSKEQVLALLKSMGLEQYQKSFQTEEVDGAILAECNEHVLEHELGVISKIHKIRLMKVIKEKVVVNVFNNSVG